MTESEIAAAFTRIFGGLHPTPQDAFRAGVVVGQTPVQCTPGRHCARRARDLGACIAGECNPPGRAEGVEPEAPEPLTDDERAEAMAHDTLVYELSVVLMRLDGNDGDPHQLVWCGGPTPEPWGDAWQKYEEQAEAVINDIGEGSAQAMVTAFGESEWVAQVVSSGPHNFPLLQWRSADVSLGTAIGTKLYPHPFAAKESPNV
jgi:hypothetical protein